MLAIRYVYLRYLALGALATTTIWYIILYTGTDGGRTTILPSRPGWAPGGLGSLIGGGKVPDEDLPAFTRPDDHPVSELIEDARARFAEQLGKRSVTVEQAAHRYRERRGRHPPPGFDAWFAAARRADAVVVEDFFDRVHHDIDPYWGMDPLEVRRMAHDQPQRVRVRDGRADFITDNPNRPEWIQLWTALVKDMMPHLPDLDMVINVMDESRVLVPWEDITELVTRGRQSRVLFPAREATSAYTDYAELDHQPTPPYEPTWHSDSLRYWDYYAATCPPGSPARRFPSLEAQDGPITELHPTALGTVMAYTRHGFVANATAARDPCEQPHLRGMHGTFVEPISMSTATKPFPMFGGSKLPGNNELLIPGAMYLTSRKMYSGGSGHGGAWADKRDGLVWRGVASGGRNKRENWWHFQRHRFVQMMNSTTVAAVAAGDAAAGPSFVLPEEHRRPASGVPLATRVGRYADVGFTSLLCYPAQKDPATGKELDTCPYTDPFLAVLAAVPMQEQYERKYLMDVDGNSFSARWRGFLLSSSVPLKATVYAEWHDDRLMPWLHYVPVDNTFADVYGVMDYFLGTGGSDIPAHDAEARRIAHEGAEWAARVLRREDMMLYTWRLLLEYARVVDPARDRLGYVADLTDAM